MNPYYENNQQRFLIQESNLKYFPAHLHINIEMLYITKGPYTMVLEGEKQTFETGDFVIIFPNVIHAYENNNNEGKTIVIMCNREYFGESANTLLNFTPKKHYVKAELVHSDIKLALDALYKERQQESINTNAVKSLLQLIFARILPELDLENQNSTSSQNMTSQIITYICENFKDDISLDVLSMQLGISKSYISQIFSHKIKISLNDYINAQRIQYAKMLLKSQEDLSILEISQKCGYETQRTFNRVFKKHCGMSPREFKLTN